MPRGRWIAAALTYRKEMYVPSIWISLLQPCALPALMDGNVNGLTYAGELDATTLGRTATIVGQRRNVDNLGDFDACTMYGADS